MTPWGTIEATHHKGTLMGNRGDLHAPDGSLGRPWRSRRWISCLLDTGDGWRAPMDEPGRNYPLFFHDEAVALAAGHRPCGECRPDALAAFIEAWKIGHGMKSRDWLPLREIDRQLHLARLAEMRHRPRVDVASLPGGVFVWCPTLDARPLLIADGAFHPWRHGEYGAVLDHAALRGRTYQITSSPIINVISAGYRPATLAGVQRVATPCSVPMDEPWEAEGCTISVDPHRCPA